MLVTRRRSWAGWWEWWSCCSGSAGGTSVPRRRNRTEACAFTGARRVEWADDDDACVLWVVGLLD